MNTMDIELSDRFKHREIHFRHLDPAARESERAARFLAGVDGILRLEPQSPQVLGVSYDLLKTSLKEIEDALVELGLHLDNGLVHRLRRALHHYTEETFRVNRGLNRQEPHAMERIFVHRYEALQHGCRDRRPEHWRRYL